MGAIRGIIGTGGIAGMGASMGMAGMGAIGGSGGIEVSSSHKRSIAVDGGAGGAGRGLRQGLGWAGGGVGASCENASAAGKINNPVVTRILLI
jgi:hypothetical protein